jgi:omega-amidase
MTRAQLSQSEDNSSSGPQKRLTIALAQMNVTLGQPKVNCERAASLIARARRLGSDLVILPELFSTGYDLENVGSHASVLTGRARRANWFGRFGALAKANGVWLTGTLLEAQADGRYYNCMPLYNHEGSLVAAYRKIHLFRLMEEEQYLAPGQDTSLIDLPWGRAGLAICYDLRFPELFRRYAVFGAQLVIVPAQWPSAREDHWRTLLRARAIENQCYVAGCNRVGTSKDTTFCGRSAVIDPWGRTLVEGGNDEELLTVTVDLEDVDTARHQIPVFGDRRPELY